MITWFSLKKCEMFFFHFHIAQWHGMKWNYVLVTSIVVEQGIIQKKLAFGSRMLPYLVTFIWNFILIWKCQKWSLNRGILVSATATYQTKCPFIVLSPLFCALFCSSGCCPMILDYSMVETVFSVMLWE